MRKFTKYQAFARKNAGAEIRSTRKVDRDYFHARYFRASNSMAAQLAAVFTR